MSDTVPIYGERYLQNIIDRKIASENDVDYAEIIKKIIHTSSLENDYVYYQMRTHAKDHHSLERLFRGDNVYIRDLAEAANLAEMDIFLIHERNQIFRISAARENCKKCNLPGGVFSFLQFWWICSNESFSPNNEAEAKTAPFILTEMQCKSRKNVV